jgi:hypothetical protein
MDIRRWIVGASGGAVALGGLALAFGACCVAPWAVSLLGVAGAVALARLAFLQPYLVGGVLLLLALAIGLVHRPRLACGACGPQTQRHLRWLVWFAAAVAAALAGASYAPIFMAA